MKLVVAADGKCKQYTEEKQMNNSNEWLDEVNEIIFNYKRKVRSWLKDTNEDDGCSKASSNTKSHSKRFSRRSSISNSSGSSKSGRVEGTVKFAELLAQEAFLEKHQQVENEGQRLRMQEKLAKSRARVQIL